tara:strand:- start:35 stop:313 length:279 start_codon:yes stop_codon:yes gene_type:complete
MKSSEKILKLMSDFIENGILSSQDAKNELINSLKFRRDQFVEKLDLVPREEFEILKKIVNKQQIQINSFKNLKKKNNFSKKRKKKFKKAKKS